MDLVMLLRSRASVGVLLRPHIGSRDGDMDTIAGGYFLVRRAARPAFAQASCLPDEIVGRLHVAIEPEDGPREDAR